MSLLGKITAWTDGRQKDRWTRRGEDQVTAEASTYETVAAVTIHADGSGSFTLTRRGEIVRILWNAEAGTEMIVDAPQWEKAG